MKECRTCGEPNRRAARVCQLCKEPMRTANLADLVMPDRAIGIAAEFAIFGGVLMALGPFLPFAEVQELTHQGRLSAGVESVAMVCAGAIAVVFGVAGLFLRRRYAYWFLPCAAATAAMTLYCQLAVENALVAERLTTTGWGLGIHFCYLGSLLSFLAAAACLVRRPAVPLSERLAGAAELLETGFRPRPREVLSYREALERRRASGDQ